MRIALLLSVLLSSLQVMAQVRCDDIFPAERKKYSIPGDDETLVMKGSLPVLMIHKDESIKILVWNIFKAKKKNFWPDFMRLQKQAHFVLVQENILNPSLCETYNNLDNMSWATSLSFWTNSHTATGVTNGSRYIASEQDFIRSPDREPLLNTPKMAGLSKFPIKGSDSELAIVNLHGINFTPASHLKNQLNAIAKRIEGHTGPLIVAGDFNTKNSKRMNILDAFASRFSLENLKLENDYRSKGRRLDHILARGFNVQAAKIIPDVQSSDHPALWAELKFAD